MVLNLKLSKISKINVSTPYFKGINLLSLPFGTISCVISGFAKNCLVIKFKYDKVSIAYSQRVGILISRKTVSSLNFSLYSSI